MQLLDLPAQASAGICFHPDDARLLAWTSASDDASQKAKLFVGTPVAAAGEDPEPAYDVQAVVLPVEVGEITEAAWLHGDAVVLSVPEVGLLTLDIVTGKAAQLWEFPKGPLPRLPVGATLQEP